MVAHGIGFEILSYRGLFTCSVNFVIYVHIYIRIYMHVCILFKWFNDSQFFTPRDLIFWSGFIKFVLKVFCWKIFVDAVLYIFYVNSSLLSAFLFVSIFVAVCHIYWFYEKSTWKVSLQYKTLFKSLTYIV